MTSPPPLPFNSRSSTISRLKKAGATVMGNISGATDILIAGDKAGGKLQKAAQLGVEVWDEAKLMTILSKMDEGKGKEKAMDIEDWVNRLTSPSTSRSLTRNPTNNIYKGEGDAGPMQEEPDVKAGSDEEAEGAEVDSHLPKPKNLMKDGETFEVSSNTSSSTYTIKRCFGGVSKYLFPF